MTLIVGIRSTESVVLAADSAATMVSGAGRPTARQRTKKLSTVAEEAVLGLSGYDGMAQEMALALEGCLTNAQRDDWSESDFRWNIRTALATTIQRTVNVQQGLGVSGRFDPYATQHSMLAVRFRSTLRLYMLEPECSLTELVDDLPCGSVGSGQPIADPFLAFIRRVLWKEKVPNPAQAEMAAYWTIQHAIHTNTGGVAGPIQLMVVSLDGAGAVRIVERGEAEAAEIESAIELAEETLHSHFVIPPREGALEGENHQVGREVREGALAGEPGQGVRSAEPPPR